ncbi:WASH complex subunit 2-like isoform X1 [Linepithema humile]|uniref:WASH complex subunit 2-like isoform X1 n=2 Tax=Linepithema humile TaxID=83485 RepID=UPI00351F13FE
MDVSDDVEKSWDHPWTTEEMKKKRREWSLAGDVGLLKHLQQFSENLVSKANKTQAALDTLTTQLKETEILVDNVTNTSLALANTQFIESRVQEDDIEIKENSEEKQENVKLQDSTPESLLASISESVKQGLNIMDEKYKVMDVACSDSEEEDDGGAVVFSVIVGPNDPYQDRPLPYVIGSNKWTTSNKIGLESSSSESEQADEERDESESEKEEAQTMFSSRHNPEINIARLSSSSSDSDNYNNPSSNVSYMNNSKTDAMSQNNMNSASESTTPNNISKTSNETAPNFAEELAKRLGTVRQAQKPAVVDEASESSINRFKDDLFASEKDEGVFNDGADSLFSNKKGLFDDQVSANLWKEKSTKSYKNNIIPASIDVPPPISIVSTKPKSAIDDLFADADSEEDSDIFSSKNTVKKRTKESSDNTNTEDKSKKFLDAIAPGFANNIATSTPDSNIKASGLFSDDENDDGDLFGNSKKQSHKSPSASHSTNTTQESNRKLPVGGVSLLNYGFHVASDISENKLASRIMQRQQESSDSSDSDAPGNSDSTAKSNIGSASAQWNTSSNITASENVSAVNENSSSTSGISIRPTSIDITLPSGLFEREIMSSTRLRSGDEEIYRERVTSDSLFVARTNQPVDASSANANDNTQQQPSRQEQDIFSPAQQDSVFENDDLFGPPPLPSKSDSKRAAKSKVSSLFDDSDSGDELFSAASSGSRSQKSTDFLGAAAPSNDRAKPLPRSGGLFDDDVDIFGGKDAPDVDIFGVTSKSKTRDVVSDDLFDSRGQDSIAAKNSNADKLPPTRMESKKISLFDDGDGDGDDGDLFAVKPTKSKNERKTELFEDDLFLSTEASSKERSSLGKDAAVEPKIDVSKNVSSLEAKKMDKDFSQGELFSKTTKTRSLFEEDDDYDDLFGTKDAVQRNNDRLKSESKEEIDKKVIDRVQKLPERDKDSLESSSSNLDAKTTTDSSVVVEKSVNEERSKAELEETFPKEDSTTKRNSPPKTLNIRTIPSPPSEDQNNQQAPRKLVSGKIKNLMGKMGDLKILSPMDAPPLWRKSEEKPDEDEDIVDKDGDLSIAGRVSPPSVSEGSARKESSYSTISSTSNTEVAINFDDLAQVETLSTTASKSRVRIQAKRRPPSRHARKSALRHSGIDFDTVDNADNDNSQEESHTSTFSSTKDLSAAPTNNATDHLTVHDNAQRPIEPSSMDDRSELGSISKESSMSVNKNTLLSPSTDEEDLFDVPPDLPEDPQKEDALFGRAPILSPVDSGRSDKMSVAVEPLIETVIRKIDDNDITSNKGDKQDSDELTQSDAHGKSESKKRDDKHKEIDDELSEAKIESSEEPCDPLRDSSHDPLKDPSQLFAFVTKTPSPEKSKGLLFTEPDDSLFSSGPARKPSVLKKKEILDLFADDDTGGDLFSAAPLKRTVKKPLRETKIDLFGDDNAQNDEDDSLFGSVSSKMKLDNQKSNPAQVVRKKNLFDDDDDDDSSLFIESSGQSQKSDSASFSELKPDLPDSQTKSTSNLKDIFGDAPCDDDDDVDLFATKKVVPKKVIASSKSLFASDDDDDDDSHIFGKQSSASIDSKARLIATNSRPAMKKSVTRDLKKTAEKIVEDPLSLLQDD